MAALDYTVVQTDQDLWGTLESIQSNLDASGTKQLLPVADPLVSPSLIDPPSNYQFE